MEEKNAPLSTPDVQIDRLETSFANSLEEDINQMSAVSTKHLTETNEDVVVSDITPSGATQTVENRNDINDEKTNPITDKNREIRNSSAADDATVANSGDGLETSSVVVGKEIDSSGANHLADATLKISTAKEDASLKADQVRAESETVRIPRNINGEESGNDPQPEPSENVNIQLKTHKLPKKIQDQLDEVAEKNWWLGNLTFSILDIVQLSLLIVDNFWQAQGLLKSAVSTGQSKEARLARVSFVLSYLLLAVYNLRVFPLHTWCVCD